MGDNGNMWYRKFVIGFRTKLLEPQGRGLQFDDSSLNGIELICNDQKILMSSQSPNGTWDLNINTCANNQSVNGFFYGMENKAGEGDDAATTINSLEGIWSSSIVKVNCANGVIVGIRTQVEVDNDHTGLNNVEFLCQVIEWFKKSYLNKIKNTYLILNFYF